MSTSFPRMLALLRKEKGLSQKFVAEELGVSQALLSHYEKGIRNPGLEFLVRVADYYRVSTDYLLGRSPERQGQTIEMDDIPEPDALGKENQGVEGIYTQLNKKLIANSLNILFDMLTRIGHKGFTGEVSSYLMLAVYRMYRVVYGSNPKNQNVMFGVPEGAYSAYADAAMQIVEIHAKLISGGTPLSGVTISHPENLVINTNRLSEDYPLFASSLLNLVQTAENRINYQSKEKK